MSAPQATVPSLRVTRLRERTAVAFASLTFSHLQSRLRLLDRHPERLAAFGASDECGEPAGLILLEFTEDEQARPLVEVSSLFVRASHRRRGAGRQLLGAAENFAREHARSRLRFAYYSGKTTTEGITAFLHACGWPPPVIHATVCTLDCELMRKAWNRVPVFPDSLEVFPWANLTPADRQALLDDDGHGYPRWLSPFKNEERLDPRCSLGLREKAGRRVIGWSIAERITPDTLLYGALFIAESYQSFAYGYLLLSDSVRRHLATDVRYGMFTVHVRNQPMQKLMRRRLLPYAVRVSEMLMATRDFAIVQP